MLQRTKLRLRQQAFKNHRPSNRIFRWWSDIISFKCVILFQGNLAGPRLAVVKEVFKRADKTVDGVVTFEDFKG